ncbi:hypothetical protein H0H93_007595 [Arthromyces matolae]|nr:hypothetical protein H0H93_007595 [Arthromyces matolae]
MPTSDTPYNPWMTSNRLTRSLVFELERVGNAGSSSRFLWKVGDMARPGVLNVQVDGRVEEVAERSVTHIVPDDKNAHVIIVDPEDVFYCEEYKVLTCGPDKCRLGKWGRPKATHLIIWRDTKNLAVIKD